MLRLHTKTNTEELPRLHHSLNPEPAHPLHCLEQILFDGVSFTRTECFGCAHEDHCSQLFGEDEDATGELDDAEKQGENGKHLDISHGPGLTEI
jgi:hypothetical protein